MDWKGRGASPRFRAACKRSFLSVGQPTCWARFRSFRSHCWRTFLGGPVKEKQDAAKAASPITYVTADDPPTLFMQGTKDPLVPHGQAVEMAEALTKVGVPGRVELLIGEGHAWPKENERVMRVTYEFSGEVFESVSGRVAYVGQTHGCSNLE